MSQTKEKDQRFIAVRRLARKPVAVAVAVFAVTLLAAAPIVAADSIQQQIDNLSAQNSKKKSSVSSLQIQASSYQDAVNKLQIQISSLQAAIATSQAQQVKIQGQIQKAQAELNYQKQILGSDIKAMYVDGQMTTIEELATSKNLSDFVDAETYRNAVQGEVQNTLTQITQLENKLVDQKKQVDQLLQTQQSKNTKLNSDEQQKQQLLSYNQTEQSQYNNQIKSNDAQIQKLQAEKVAELQALGGTSSYGGTGSYPWADAPCLDGPDAGSTCGDYDWGYPSGSAVPLGAPAGPYDPWGYEYRNCTSYVAWKIDSISTSPTIGSLISYLGNAAQWPSNVPSGWIDNAPRQNDAAVDPGVADGQGHVMFIEKVNGDGTINVSQYNVVPGSYSTTDNMSTTGLIFIHFPGT